MTDELAISLFVKDGGMAHEWHAVDQVVRNHYEKLALEEGQRPCTALSLEQRPRSALPGLGSRPPVAGFSRAPSHIPKT